MKKVTVLLMLAMFLSACLPAQNSAPTPTAIPAAPATTTPAETPAPLPWWRTAVFYEIFVRSFNDSNGDGIGDFKGLTAKLDYLQNLGVTALWLMPIHASPSYHGYDVINYFNVNPDYGTLEDFKRLLAEAHRRGMRVIIDLVLNHTSSQDPLFVDANNSRQSAYRDWFLWSDTNPGTSGSNGPSWHTGKFGYYYAVFGDGMPDFNYTKPDVTAFMDKVVQFWLNSVGVDGFRLDAVKYLIEEGPKLENTASTHHWLQGFFTAYKADKPDAYTVGEVFGADAILMKTYAADQLDELFNFELASGIVNSAAGEANSGINSALTFMLQNLPDGRFASFLTNHDQNRVMSVLNGNLNRAKIAAAMLFTAPGTPFIYYGEEIGMTGKKPDEDLRRPMQWSGEANAGFSSGKAWRAPAADFPKVNVAAESLDPNSLLNFYREMTGLRAQHPALQTGSLALLAGGNPGVYAILRSSPGENILVVLNLTKSAIQNYNLSAQALDLPDGLYQPEALRGSGAFPALNISNHGFSDYKLMDELPAYSIHILTLKP
jgi:alpha-amylase